MTIYLLVGGISLLTGTIAGLVGIGGGIVMAPLLIYLPPLFGLAPLDMRTVAGLTIVQGLTACVTGAFTHHRFQFVSVRLSAIMGGTIFISAFLGGAGAAYVSNEALILVFAGLALVAAVLMLTRTSPEDTAGAAVIAFNPFGAAVIAAVVGVLGGLVGQGGSFILIPLMIHVLGVATRIAIGSNLAIVAASAAAGFIGKALTGQIVWAVAVPIVIATVPATYLGSLMSARTPVLLLRRVLGVLISLSALNLLWEALG